MLNPQSIQVALVHLWSGALACLGQVLALLNRLCESRCCTSSTTKMTAPLQNGTISQLRNNLRLVPLQRRISAARELTSPPGIGLTTRDTIMTATNKTLLFANNNNRSMDLESERTIQTGLTAGALVNFAGYSAEECSRGGLQIMRKRRAKSKVYQHLQDKTMSPAIKKVSAKVYCKKYTQLNPHKPDTAEQKRNRKARRNEAHAREQLAKDPNWVL